VKRLESSIEKSVVDYARKHGVESIKLTTQGPRGAAGWPDRLFLGRDMQVRWIEFKAEGGQLTELQKRRHVQLAKYGWTTAVVRSVEEGRAIIDNMRLFPVKPDPRQMRMRF
jgi:hypothetical protein